MRKASTSAESPSINKKPDEDKLKKKLFKVNDIKERNKQIVKFYIFLVTQNMKELFSYTKNMKKLYIILALMLIIAISKPSHKKVLDSVEPVNAVQSPYEITEPILDSVNVVPSTDVESKPRSNVKVKTFDYPSGYNESSFKSKSQSNVKQRKSVKFKCDGRKHCSQMRSCAEAKFFIRNCRDTLMDGDGDGIPCERQHCGHR